MSKRLTMAGIAALAAAGMTAQAAIIATETWPTAGDDRDWTLTDQGGSVGVLSVPASIPPGTTPALRVDVDTGAGISVDHVSTTGGDGTPFLGDYSTYNSGQQIKFDFYYDTAAFGSANGLDVFFNSSTATGVNWFYNINVSGQPANTWATYTLSFASDDGWTDEFAGGNFLLDRQNVTEIGFRLTYLESTSDQVYGFDNLTRIRPVPEPETYAAIAFALISLCITFRRQIGDKLRTVQALGNS